MKITVTHPNFMAPTNNFIESSSKPPVCNVRTLSASSVTSYTDNFIAPTWATTK